MQDSINFIWIVKSLIRDLHWIRKQRTNNAIGKILSPISYYRKWTNINENGSRILLRKKEIGIWWEEKRMRSDSVLWQKPTDRKSKKQRDNTKTPTKTSITQWLWTDLGRSVGVTIATKLVWLNRFTGSKPSINRKSRIIKRTHI